MRLSSQMKIVEMQCELLISDFKNPTTIALMQENIGHISDGSSPHSANALKLGFKKASEFKKQNSGVLLRCPNTGCGYYSNPAPYTFVGSNTYCPQCYNNYRYKDYNNNRYSYMQCVGCGYQRTNNSLTSCQGCKKKFS